MRMSIPGNKRGQLWRYGFRVRHPERMERAIEMNPILTLAQLALLSPDDQEIVHKNMEEGEFAEIRSKEHQVFP